MYYFGFFCPTVFGCAIRISLIFGKSSIHGSCDGRRTGGRAATDRVPHRATSRARASVVAAVVRVGTAATVGDDASSRVGVRGVEFGVGVGVGVVFAFAFVVVVVVVVVGDGGRPAVDARGGDVRGRVRGRRAGEGVVVECVDRFVVELDAFVGFAVG